MAIKVIFHINVNCTNLDVSQPFYENLGFEVVHEIPEGSDSEMLRGLGLRPLDISTQSSVRSSLILVLLLTLMGLAVFLTE